MAQFSFQMKTRTRLMARLSIGFLLREMFERFQMKANGTLNRKMFIYSAHDLTIVSLLRALNLAEVTELLLFLSIFLQSITS